MKKLQLFQLLFPFIILKLSKEMNSTNEQTSAFKKYVRDQRASGLSLSWQQPDSQGASLGQQSDTFMNTHPYSQVFNLPYFLY